MRSRHPRVLGMLVMAIVLMVTTACGAAPKSAPAASPAPAPAPAPAAPPQPATPPPAPVKVKLRFDFLINAYAVPFVVAQEKGIFKKYGLDVELSEGKGSASTAQAVGQDQFEFGLSDAGATAVAISKEVPIKAVAGIMQKNNQGIIYLGDKTQINSAKDLIGKAGGYFQGSGSLKLLGAIRGVNAIKEDQITLRLMDSAARVPALLEGKIDFTGGTLDGDFLRARSQNPNAKFLSVFDAGVKIQGITLVTANKMIKEKPALVKAFIAASAEAWKYALANQEEAAAIGVKYFPEAKQESLLAGLKLDAEYLTTPNTQGKPFGWMSEDDWKQTVEIMSKFADLEKPGPVNLYYTNEFVPAS